MVARTGTTGVRIAFQFGINHFNFYDVESQVQIPIGQFTHVAGIWDGIKLRLYINGVLDAQSTPEVAPVDARGDFFMGGFDSPAPGSNQYVGQFFQGAIDELSYYNRALSSNQIAAINSADSAGKCPLPPRVLSLTPTNYYVNEGTNVSYQVVAAGSPTLTYQWQHDGFNLPGATNSMLTLSDVKYPQVGNHDVVVSNLVGSTASSKVELRVNRSPLADPRAT